MIILAVVDLLILQNIFLFTISYLIAFPFLMIAFHIERKVRHHIAKNTSTPDRCVIELDIVNKMYLDIIKDDYSLKNLRYRIRTWLMNHKDECFLIFESDIENFMQPLHKRYRNNDYIKEQYMHTIFNLLTHLYTISFRLEIEYNVPRDSKSGELMFNAIEKEVEELLCQLSNVKSEMTMIAHQKKNDEDYTKLRNEIDRLESLIDNKLDEEDCLLSQYCEILEFKNPKFRW